MQTLAPAQREAVLRVVAANRTRPGALIEILHGVQAELGFIPPAAVPVLAQELNLSRAEVHGVVSFYHYFRHSAPGQQTIRVCQAESCQAAGSAGLTAFAKKQMGIDFHQTTADKACSLEPVYCLGNCALSPSVMVDKEVFGRVTEQRFNEILAEAREP